MVGKLKELANLQFVEATARVYVVLAWDAYSKVFLNTNISSPLNIEFAIAPHGAYIFPSKEPYGLQSLLTEVISLPRSWLSSRDLT